MNEQRRVTTIPATLQRFTSQPISVPRKRRTAAYARVSTDTDEQLSSYDMQVRYYTDYIQNRTDWEFAGIYTDEGITGTSTTHREGFKQMMKDALDGKIDLIITKSVSRFARNTVDSLTSVRELKEKGVEVYFEKENIWTLDSKGELLITIMSSLAQEEARSISENVTWGIRKRFADGKVSMAYGCFLGYSKGPDGAPVVVEEEAETVRLIYSLFLQGKPVSWISSYLTECGIKSPGGKDKWYRQTVASILANEKYCGNAILQKTYVSDFLTKKTKKNNGEIPKYFVENSHPAIISVETFMLAQEEFKTRKEGLNNANGKSVFAAKVRCGKCGSLYSQKTWHSNDKYRKVIWRCADKYVKRGEHCDSPHLSEEDLKNAAVKAINMLIKDKDRIINEIETVLLPVFDTGELTDKHESLERKLKQITETAGKLVEKNSRTAIDQAAYQEEFSKLTSEYERLKSQADKLASTIEDKNARRLKAELFIRNLKTSELLDEFSEELFCTLVDHMTVYSKTQFGVTFRDGEELTVELD